MKSDIIKLGTAMAALEEYGREHKCATWLERLASGRWHARIMHYGVYDGGSQDADPLKAAINALVYARHAESERADCPEESKEA